MKRCYETPFYNIPIDVFTIVKPHLIWTQINKALHDLCSQKITSLRITPPDNNDAPDDVLPLLLQRFSNIKKLELGPHSYYCGSNSISINKEKYLRSLIAHLLKNPLGHLQSLKIHEIDWNNLPSSNEAKLHMQELNGALLSAFGHSNLQSVKIVTHATHSFLGSKEIHLLLDRSLKLKKFKLIGALNIHNPEDLLFTNHTELVSVTLHHLVGQPKTLESLSTCQNLHSLALRCFFYNAGASSVLSAHSWHLTHLEIQNIAPDDNLEALTKQLPNLEHLTISGGFNPNYEHLKALSVNCLMLRTFSISYSNLNNRELDHFTQGLSNLETISFEGPKITSEGVSAIAKNCPKLTCLHLKNIKSLDHKGIKALMQHCLHLTEVQIVLSGSTQFDERIAQKFKARTSLTHL